MKNKNLILLIAIMMIFLVACDREKQEVIGNNIITSNSGEIVEIIESGEELPSGEESEEKYYEITLSKIESYEYEISGDVLIHKYELSGMKDLKSQKMINDKLESLYNDVKKESEKIKENENLPELDCIIKLDSEDIFSFCISKKLTTNNETYVKEFYTLSKHTGELMELSDFYEEDDYLRDVSVKIYNEFTAKKSISGDTGYFFDLNEKDLYEKIKLNAQSFYISEDNELVYYFQKYELGLGEIGEQEFILIENIEL